MTDQKKIVLIAYQWSDLASFSTDVMELEFAIK
jgi:hypothetical protein